MSTSPSKATVPIGLNHPSTLTRQRSNNNINSNNNNLRTLRKLKSAHVLSSSSSSHHPPTNGNTPSLISLQRQQQQQQQQQQQHRSLANKDTTSHHPAVPPVPPLPTISSHTRSRSSSDAAVIGISTHHAPTTTTKRHVVPKKLVTTGLGGGGITTKPTMTVTSLEGLVRDGPRNGDVIEGLQSMRRQVLSEGVTSDTDGMSSLRIYVWLILLCAPPIATDDYLKLIHRGPSPAYAKIRNDTFRTLATDPLFRRRVSEASLIRLLNAVAWSLYDAKEEERSRKTSPPVLNMANSEGSPELRQALPSTDQTVVPTPQQQPQPSSSSTITKRERSASEVNNPPEAGTYYVQGMNVLAAPFLYAARSEAEAFVAFYRFISFECPGYVRGAMDGVHKGLSLVDRVLTHVDPKLSSYLLSKHLTAELYAFPSVLTLCACTPPLPEVLHLWDFLFAYGAHLNLLCIVAQLIMMRGTLLDCPSPVKMLRSFPPLQANRIKWLTVNLVKEIPAELYEEIVRHAK